MTSYSLVIPVGKTSVSQRMPPGNYTAVAKSTGYQDDTQKFAVEGDDKIVEFEMRSILDPIIDPVVNPTDDKGSFWDSLFGGSGSKLLLYGGALILIIIAFLGMNRGD